MSIESLKKEISNLKLQLIMKDTAINNITIDNRDLAAERNKYFNLAESRISSVENEILIEENKELGMDNEFLEIENETLTEDKEALEISNGKLTEENAVPKMDKTNLKMRNAELITANELLMRMVYTPLTSC